MSELGLRLKHARESKGITLEELQEITKIQKRYLFAIEEGRLETLPGQFYARAFIKSYAEAVGINPEMLFEEHANEFPNLKKQEEELPPRVYTKKRRASGKTEKYIEILPAILVMAVVLIGLIGFWYVRSLNSNEKIPREETQYNVIGERDEETYQEELEIENSDPTEEPIEEVEEIDPVVEQEPQEFVLVETNRNETVYDLINANQFDVRIILNDTSYIGINNEKGMSFYAQNASKDDTLEFDFSEEETIRFNFGASNNVELYINEQLFDFPLDVVHQKVTINFVQNHREAEEDTDNE